jgi:hypothetical protein
MQYKNIAMVQKKEFMNNLILIFPSCPSDYNKVDDNYKKEFDLAKKSKLDTILFSYERLLEGKIVFRFSNNKDPEKYLDDVLAETGATRNVIYRGWMLTPNKYQFLYRTLKHYNHTLVNTPMQYVNCHYLPFYYGSVKKWMGKATWFTDIKWDSVDKALKEMDGLVYMIKDFVKSEDKLHYKELINPDNYTCDDVTSMYNIIRMFIDDREPLFNEGIVLKEMLNLKLYGDTGGKGKFIHNEWRYFFIRNGNDLEMIAYPKKVISGMNAPKYSFVKNIATKLDSNFFTIDVAESDKINDHWVNFLQKINKSKKVLETV